MKGVPRLSLGMWRWWIIATTAVLVMTPVAVAGAQGVHEDVATESRAKGAESVALEQPVTVDADAQPLTDVLDAFAASANVRILYQARELSGYRRRVTVHAHGISLRKALELALAGTGLRAVPLTQTSVGIVESSEAQLQDGGIITGRVFDSATGRPLERAVVGVRGTKLFVSTNAQGRFEIHDVPLGEQTVSVRLLGYRAMLQRVTVASEATEPVTIALAATASVLEQVVTTATGARRRVEVPNQVTKLDVEEIMKTAPVTTVTDVLIGRVPGLTVMKTSGAPGDPTRLRLRGVSSITQSNDPIVIVDGIRIYNAVSDPRNANATLQTPSINPSSNSVQSVPAPSPLDQIDPNTIATIEVFNGPSATAMYGSDAASGVIVITTKRGKAGPAHWTFRGGLGTSSLRTSYPERYFRVGHDSATGSTPTRCLLGAVGCIADTLIVFNAAAQGGLSPVGRGSTYDANLMVSGGTAALRYSLTGTYNGELGILRLPGRAEEQYRRRQGGSPPSWMRQPERVQRQGGTVRLDWTASPQLSFAYTGDVTQTHQTKSSLSTSVVTAVSMTYADPLYEEYYLLDTYFAASPSNTYLADFYRRSWDDQLQIRQSGSTTWSPVQWLSFWGDGGVAIGTKEDHGALKQGMLSGFQFGADSGGYVRTNTQRTTMTTFNLRASTRALAANGVSITPSFGVNYVGTAQSDVSVAGSDLSPGLETMTGAAHFTGSDGRQKTATFGMFSEMAFNLWNQLYFSPAIRRDGGSSFGERASLFAMPKLGGSWLLSSAPFFPKTSFIDAIRVRTAYGQSGRQPGPADRVRVYQPTSIWLDGTSRTILTIASYGNGRLRPERSLESEFGADIDLLEGRFTSTITWYNKLTRDAIVDAQVAPSVAGGAAVSAVSIAASAMSKPVVNIGRVRNRGFEASLAVTPMRTSLVNWTTSMNYSQNRNVLLKLNPDAAFLNLQQTTVRYVEGYPLAGMWNFPVVGYADVNGDGVITAGEVQYADSAVYQGAAQQPKFNLALSNTVSLFNSRILLGAQLTYTNRQPQVNDLLRRTITLSRALNDPTASLASQALARAIMGPLDRPADDYAITQTVSTLRFNSVNVSYRMPHAIASRLKASNAMLSLQGSNLAIHSNYSGLDPDMNVLNREIDGTRDAGTLPSPRTWRLGVDLSY